MPSSRLQSSTIGENDPEQSKAAGVPWLGLSLPLILMAVLIFFSPNFRQTEAEIERATPLGGDLVQEWVGGYIAGSSEQSDRDRLYDLKFVKSIQHLSLIHI